MLNIQEIAGAVEPIASEYEIKKVMLFGSYADGSNTADSDVDLLVEFYAPYVSLLTISALKNQLEDVLKTEVDIIRLPIPEGSLINPESVVQIYAS